MALPVATEVWSARQYTKQTSAVRAFDVAYAESEEDALNAVAGQQSVYRNSSHPLDPQLRVTREGLVVTRPGFGLYRVTANYAVGTFDSQNDKTLEAPTYQWLPENVTEQVSTDIHGELITNSAGDQPSQSPTRQVSRLAIAIARYESKFPVRTHNTYANAYNSDTFTINGYVIEPGQAFCSAVTQVAEMKLTANPVRVRYLLKFHPGFYQDTNGVWDGFSLRFPDKGKRAWFTINGTDQPGHIYLLGDSGKYDRVSEDVLLNGYGATYSKDYTTDNGGASVRNPNWTAGGKLFTPKSGYGNILVWENYKNAPFAALGLFY